MAQQGRTVKEPSLRVVRLAEVLLSLIWLWAVLAFLSSGGVDFVRRSLTDRFDPTPLLIALTSTAIVYVGMLMLLRRQTAVQGSLRQLETVHPEIFEHWVAARLRELGYAIRIASPRADPEVDLLAEKPGELAVVQYKNYRAGSVGEPALRELFGAMHDFGADRAYLVTAGQLTPSAVAWVSGKPIEVWDRDRLAHLWQESTVQAAYAARSR